MKKITILLALFFVSTCYIAAQADKILGFYLSEESDAQIKIFKATNGKYYGKIVWLDDPLEDDGVGPNLDDKNPDESLRSTPVLGLRLLNGFSYDSEDNEWSDGTIYDPKSGKTYSCYMWFDEENPKKLNIKGFVMGMRFIGRSSVWTMESTERKME
ncbi:MAG: DUF2147 domain-containing protein [Bacteroidales bacterium]|nr:DUF2147 domain-containing protein [Bacteroidales bacterium]